MWDLEEQAIQEEGRSQADFLSTCQVTLYTSPPELRSALATSYHILLGQTPPLSPLALLQRTSPVEEQPTSAAPPIPNMSYSQKLSCPTITSNVKFTKVDKTPNSTLYTTPVTPPNTPSKPIICNILSKWPLNDTEKANMKRIWKDVVSFNFHDEIDDSELLKAVLNSTWTLFWTNSMLYNICYMHSCNHIWQLCSVVLFGEWKYKSIVKFVHF